jgi:hypothetical protein
VLIDTSDLDTQRNETGLGEAGTSDVVVGDGGDGDGDGASSLRLDGGRVNRDAGVRWETNGHVYELIVTGSALSWTAARDQAVSLGGHLATLTSAAENEFVYRQVIGSAARSATAGPWIGGFQDPVDAAVPTEAWKWVTGEPWSFTAWAQGAPDDNNGRMPEYCLHYYSPNGSRNPTWHDGPLITGSAAFVVEFEP